MDKRFRPANSDQPLLLPADLREWLPQGNLAIRMSKVAVVLGLSAFYACGRAAGHKLRKAIAGLPLGQIKEVRHFRRFPLRGKPKVTGERRLITLRHNVLPRNLILGFKLHRAGAARAPR